MDKNISGYIELTRIIMAKNLNVPPDDIDMFAIFNCAARAIKERVKTDNNEFILKPNNDRESTAILSNNGNVIIKAIFDKEYPFCEFIDKYENWYIENLSMDFLKMNSFFDEDMNE